MQLLIYVNNLTDSYLFPVHRCFTVLSPENWIPELEKIKMKVKILRILIAISLFIEIKMSTVKYVLALRRSLPAYKIAIFESLRVHDVTLLSCFTKIDNWGTFEFLCFYVCFLNRRKINGHACLPLTAFWERENSFFSYLFQLPFSRLVRLLDLLH